MINYEALEENKSLALVLRGEDESLEVFGKIFKYDMPHLGIRYIIYKMDYRDIGDDYLHVDCEIGLAADESGIKTAVDVLEMPEYGWFENREDVTLDEDDKERIRVGAQVATEAVRKLLVTLGFSSTTPEPGEQN